MPIRTSCPSCQARYNLPDAMNGKKVRCAKCNQTMVVALEEPPVLEAVEVAEEPVRPAVKKSRMRPDEEIDDQGEVTVKKSRARPDEEMDDQEEEQPRQRKRVKARKGATSQAGLGAIAFYQRAILLCILGNLLAGVLFAFLPPAIGVLIWLALIPVGIASTVFVGLLAKELLGTALGILLGVLTLVPGIGLIVLLVVNQLATRRLKHNGIKVGLLGASMPSGTTSPLGGLSVGIVAGILVIVVGGTLAGGYFFFTDTSGPWPELPEFPGSRTPGATDGAVIFHVAGVGDQYTYDAIRRDLAKLGKTAPPGVPATLGVAAVLKDGRMTARVSGVTDAQAAAKQIEFGKVRRVSGQIITVDAKKLEGLPAANDEVAKVLFDLKSGEAHNEREVLRRLKGIKPDDRRDQVVTELNRILQQGQNPFTRADAAEALLVWAGKDKAIPTLVESIRANDYAYLLKLIPVLGSTKDERAIEPLAKLMEDLTVSAEAAKALKGFGPKAAPAVAKRLSSKDRFSVQAACELLKDVGTPDSIPELEKIARNRTDRGLAMTANNAIKAIKARQ